ncbi:unnamed protein product, partial [Effrenium voratum]
MRELQSACSTAWHVGVVVVLGAVLHPELKAFYHSGHGDMKNTVSAIDTWAACLLLWALSLGAGRSTLPKREKLRWAAPPGIFVFLVITLATWANFLSYGCYAAFGPTELVFVYAFARIWHPAERQRPWWHDLPAVLVTALGSLLCVIGGSFDASPVAMLAALLCRACQALMTVSLRSCCVALASGSAKEEVGVLEITQWKLLVTALLCLPYALLTEGLAPWRLLGDREFWFHRSGGLLLGSVLITLGFQCCTVGLNRGLRSPVAAVLQSALQPLFGLLLLVLLADGPLRHQLGLKAPTLLVPGLPSAKFADANHLAASIKGVCGFSHSMRS